MITVRLSLTVGGEPLDLAGPLDEVFRQVEAFCDARGIDHRVVWRAVLDFVRSKSNRPV